MPLNALSFALGRPSFGGGLFQVGQQAGQQGMMSGYNESVKAAQQQEVEKQQGLLNLADMARMGAQPESLAAMEQSLAARTKASAEELMGSRAVGAEALAAQQLAAKEKQELAIARRTAAQRAQALNVPTETIGALLIDPSELNAVSTHYEEEQLASNMEKLDDSNTVRAQRALATKRGAPQGILDEVNDGMYVDSPSNFLSRLNEADANLTTYLDEGGNLQTVPEWGSQIKVNGQWGYPQELGWNKAPTRTATGSAEDLGIVPGKVLNKVSVGQATLGAAADGVITPFLDAYDTVGDLQAAVGIGSQDTVNTNKTEPLRAYRAFNTQALARLVSGAAIKKDEEAGFMRMLNPVVADIFAPEAMATKVIRSAALAKADSLLSIGAITPEEARQMVLSGSSLILSKEDKAAIKKGQFASVVRPYVDSFGKLGSDDSGTTSNLPPGFILD